MFLLALLFINCRNNLKLRTTKSISTLLWILIQQCISFQTCVAKGHIWNKRKEVYLGPRQNWQNKPCLRLKTPLFVNWIPVWSILCNNLQPNTWILLGILVFHNTSNYVRKLSSKSVRALAISSNLVKLALTKKPEEFLQIKSYLHDPALVGLLAECSVNLQDLRLLNSIIDWLLKPKFHTKELSYHHPISDTLDLA